MKKKTILAILVATTMSFALTGCSKDKENNPTPVTIESVSASESEASSENGSDTSSDASVSSEENGSSEVASTEANKESTSASEGKTSSTEAGKERYEAFKNGTEKVFITMDSEYTPYSVSIDPATGYTLEELTALLQEGYEMSKNPLDVDFAYIDCGNDGVPELALQFTGLGIYSPEDDSSIVFIIKENDGKLNSYFSVESWARSFTTVNKYGIISSMGSGGAAEHGGYEGYVDPTGHFKEIFATWESGIEESDTTYSAYCTLTIDGVTHQYFCTDDESIPEDALNNYIQMNSLENVDQIPTLTGDEMRKQSSELVDEAYSKLGITEEMRNGELLFQ